MEGVCLCLCVCVCVCVSVCVSVLPWPCMNVTSVSDNSFAQDMHRQSSDDDLTSVTELAYFEGDFWPNVIEEQIKELDQEERAQASGEVSV